MQTSGAAILRVHRSLTPILHHPNQHLDINVATLELTEDVARVLGRFECIPEFAVECVRIYLLIYLSTFC